MCVFNIQLFLTCILPVFCWQFLKPPLGCCWGRSLKPQCWPSATSCLCTSVLRTWDINIFCYSLWSCLLQGILGYFIIHLPEATWEVPEDIHRGGGEVCHGHPHVSGRLLAVHGVVQIFEQVGRILGIRPGMKSFSPKVVESVLRQIVLIGHDQGPVEMPQII